MNRVFVIVNFSVFVLFAGLVLATLVAQIGMFLVRG